MDRHLLLKIRLEDSYQAITKDSIWPGKEEPLPVSVSLSIRNEEGQYEELYRMNLSEEIFRNHFTKREYEILALMTNGLTSKAIAEQLFISVDTVKTHRKRINAKLKEMEYQKEDLLLR